MAESVCTIFLTNAALTRGVVEVAAVFDDQFPDMAIIRNKSRDHSPIYVHGKGRNWFDTRAAAIARAVELRGAKIKSWRKQIARLEALTFE